MNKLEEKLRIKSPLINEYKYSKKNGICKCKNPLYLTAGYENIYCFRCKKIIKDE